MLPNVPDWLQLVLGSVLTLAGAAVQRWWGRKDADKAVERALDAERAGRREARSEEAARDLLVHIENAFEQLARYPRDEVPPREVAVTLAAPIHQGAIFLADTALRERLIKVGTVVANVDIVSKRTRSSLGVVLWSVRVDSQDALGAFLRGEPLPEESASLERYNKIVTDLYEAFAAGEPIENEEP